MENGLVMKAEAGLGDEEELRRHPLKLNGCVLLMAVFRQIDFSEFGITDGQ